MPRSGRRRTGRSDPFVPLEHIFPRPTRKGIRASPALFGGSSWPPPAYSPRTRLLYVLGSYFPMRFTVDSVYAARGGGDPFTHAYFRKLPDSLQYGVLSAVDVNTGHIRWQRRIGRHLMYGGALATESGLVFFGDSQGWLNALDAETGETLWRGRGGHGALGPPISYVVDGRQRIAVTSQRGLTVFGLPEPRGP